MDTRAMVGSVEVHSSKPILLLVNLDIFPVRRFETRTVWRSNFGIDLADKIRLR